MEGATWRYFGVVAQFFSSSEMATAHSKKGRRTSPAASVSFQILATLMEMEEWTWSTEAALFFQSPLFAQHHFAWAMAMERSKPPMRFLVFLEDLLQTLTATATSI